MMKCVSVLLLLAISAAVVDGAKTEAGANPIRRIVTMLQMMQKKVAAEGEKMEEMFDKYMCYCENSEATLGKSIEDAEEKIPQLESEIKELTGLKTQLTQELADHKATREEANKAMEQATSMREKEAKEFGAESSESKSNIDALGRAIPAIEKGMAGSFLQTEAGSMLRKVVAKEADKLAMDDRETLLTFLEQKAGYAPASGEILGILKQMKDEMEADLKEMTGEENGAIQSYDELMAAKEKEVGAATKAIEEKTARLGETAVKIAESKNDLEDTSEGLAEDKKFLADLKKNCALKTKEWEAYKKTMAMEQAALADTIKMLNDDDALDLFKKTVPSASSFLQVGVSAKEVKQQALEVLRSASKGRRSVHLDFIALALRGKAAGFEKVLKMIDDMVVLLKKEQVDDEKKKEYCEAEFDKTEDKIKATKRSISDIEAKIADEKEAIATVTDEIKALKDGIADLDRSVVAATQQRKEENAEYTTNLAANNAAVQLIEMAKNRMNKFYNPKMYKAPPKRELSEEERITLNMGGTLEPTAPPGGIAGTGVTAFDQSDDSLSFVQVRAHDSLDADLDSDAAPPPPPAADMSYKKKGEESNGVIAMMDMMTADVKKEIQEMEFEEKDSQEDYEKMMADAKEKRNLDSKTITEKEGVKAETEAELQVDTDALKAENEELMATQEYMADLHKDCDWLLENFDARKTARADEIDALGKAKAVLSGASSFLQTGATVQRLRR